MNHELGILSGNLAFGESLGLSDSPAHAAAESSRRFRNYPRIVFGSANEVILRSTFLVMSEEFFFARLGEDRERWFQVSASYTG